VSKRLFLSLNFSPKMFNKITTAVQRLFMYMFWQHLVNYHLRRHHRAGHLNVSRLKNRKWKFFFEKSAEKIVSTLYNSFLSHGRVIVSAPYEKEELVNNFVFTVTRARCKSCLVFAGNRLHCKKLH
jgi:hypothetical protein